MATWLDGILADTMFQVVELTPEEIAEFDKKPYEDIVLLLVQGSVALGELRGAYEIFNRHSSSMAEGAERLENEFNETHLDQKRGVVKLYSYLVQKHRAGVKNG